MATHSLRVLLVVGSPSHRSVTRIVLHQLHQKLPAGACEVDVLDFLKNPLPLFNPESSYRAPDYPALRARVDQADVLVLGTPDYHGSISSTLKNFLDHFWHEFAGKLFATVVGSHDKGLTVTDQLRTVARQCYAWSMPYGVCFNEKEDLLENQVLSPALQRRLEMLARDLLVYGALLAQQRRADLASSDPGFLARYRTAATKPSPQPASCGDSSAG